MSQWFPVGGDSEQNPLAARDVSERVADRVVCRLGLHPVLLWPTEWLRAGRSARRDRCREQQAV